MNKTSYVYPQSSFPEVFNPLYKPIFPSDTAFLLPELLPLTFVFILGQLVIHPFSFGSMYSFRLWFLKDTCTGCRILGFFLTTEAKSLTLSHALWMISFSFLVLLRGSSSASRSFLANVMMVCLSPLLYPANSNRLALLGLVALALFTPGWLCLGPPPCTVAWKQLQTVNWGSPWAPFICFPSPKDRWPSLPGV